MKRQITTQYKSSAICYKAIADAIYKSLIGKENANEGHQIVEVANTQLQRNQGA